jgi:hypothetical protein
VTGSAAAAGYSGTPLPRKLGITPGARVVLSGAPPDAEALLEELPEGVRLSRRLTGAVDVIREMALAAGLVDDKVCAINATWSGLRLVVRVRDRPAGTAPRRRETR